MNTAPLLAELSAAGIRLVPEGDQLRVLAPAHVDLSPFVPRIRAHKAALLAELGSPAKRTFDPTADGGNIRPLEILRHVEDTMTIRLVREGDKLRMRVRPETDVPAARERVRRLRDVLLEEILQREYVELVCGPPELFDRVRADALSAEWERRYGRPNAPEREEKTT